MQQIDITPTLATLGRAVSNVRFGVARGLTQIARAAARDITAALPQTFDRPNPFTMQAVAITPATRETLTATVFVKDQQARYLELEETGGVRTPVPGGPINLPGDIGLDAYGNIGRGRIGQLLARKDVFIWKGKGKAPPGIYQRGVTERSGPAKGRTKFARVNVRAGAAFSIGRHTLRLLVAFERSATYKPRFHFHDQVTASALARGPALIEKSVNDAVASSF